MDYRIDIHDRAGRRIASCHEAPILEVCRSLPGEQDYVRGMLPESISLLGHAFHLRVYVDGALFGECPIQSIEPAWGDEQRLILDKYVSFRELLNVEAVHDATRINTTVAGLYINRTIHEIVRHAINAAPGPLHYTIDHQAYPEGAQREYEKFQVRAVPGCELGHGSIATGQWAGGSRIDASRAVAKDGDTISGLVVDGVAWPDVRLLMIDAEETSRNSHAVSRHPEIAAWSNDQYAHSGYYARAMAARAALQTLIDANGIDYVELNPHRNAQGMFDDRVDVYGRYIALVYGGGLCFNAALVEQGLADIYLYEEGRFHVPEMALKDYFSYTGVHRNSIDETGAILTRFDVNGGLFEILTTVACAAGGYGWSLGPDGVISFRGLDRPDQVFFFNPRLMAVALGSDSKDICNLLHIEGDPSLGAFSKMYACGESLEVFPSNLQHVEATALAHGVDIDALAQGLLDDLAYPSPRILIDCFHGASGLQPGQLIELRDPPLRRLDPPLSSEWGGRFSGRLMGRVSQVIHRFTGRQVRTRIWLTSPLRSVKDPLAHIVRTQLSQAALAEFCLDMAGAGLDMGCHLDH